VKIEFDPEAFRAWLRSTETSHRLTASLEPDAEENKFYAQGIGNVLTVDLTNGETLPLVGITTECEGRARPGCVAEPPP
jgi:hypothetical protein